MQVMFVHGMGRTPRSGRSLLTTLARAGMETSTFGYLVSLESFAAITDRLRLRISNLAARGDYLLVGHSLGGVLLRAALQAGLPPRPPLQLFVLGSPFRAVRIARRLRRNLLYRILSRDCGQLLGSDERMMQIAPAPVSITSIAGTRSLVLTRPLFGGVANDGVVAVDEASHELVEDQIDIDERHTWLPANQQVATLLLSRFGRSDTQAGPCGPPYPVRR